MAERTAIFAVGSGAFLEAQSKCQPTLTNPWKILRNMLQKTPD
jgi:hypothetical protein